MIYMIDDLQQNKLVYCFVNLCVDHTVFELINGVFMAPVHVEPFIYKTCGSGQEGIGI